MRHFRVFTYENSGLMPHSFSYPPQGVTTPLQHVLVCDDEQIVRSAFEQTLRKAGYKVSVAADAQELHHALREESIEVLLLDIHLPDARGDNLIPELIREDPLLHIVVITGDSSLESATRAMRHGACDFVTKPVDASKLQYVVGRSLTARQRVLKTEISARTKAGAARQVKRLVGISAPICRINLMIDRVSRTPSTPVIITGESGSGKEMVAESIHELSARRENPLIKVNCSAIPRPLVEAELFGHERGAFTDAKQPRKGLFELADGGTIFLDEIADLDISLQPKLLRVLEDQVVTRVGSSVSKKVDVRIIAATNKNIASLCEKGEFREDLYFRLSVMHIDIPPLRDRPEDIEVLAERFLREKSAELGKNVSDFSESVLDYLRNYTWPGNVRELKNMIERMIILSDSHEIHVDEQTFNKFRFQPDSKKQEDLGVIRSNITPENPSHEDFVSTGAPVKTLEEVERDYIKRALDYYDDNRSLCARKLGISRSTLQRKITRYEL